jgi:Big-like domain-containing protein
LPLLALFLLGSCTRGAAQRQVVVTLDSASRSLEVGQTVTARAQVRDRAGNVVEDSVIWLSDNPSIARVDAQGKITAAAPGVTGITARVGASLALTRVSVYAPARPSSIAHNDVAAPANDVAAPAHEESERPRAPVRASANVGSARSPHYTHISVFYTDFYSAYASPKDREATLAFLAPRVDGIMSGPMDAWRRLNPTIQTYPYALQYEVVQAEVGNRESNLNTSFTVDMKQWYAQHPKYDYESAFLHRGGHDSTHRVAFKNESWRWLINPGDAGSRAYQADRLARIARGHAGVFLDEFGGPMYGAIKPTDEFATGAEYLASEAQLLAQAHAAMAPKILLINIAEYWTPTDSAIVVAGGGAQLERTNYPFTDRTEERWTEIDHLMAAGVYTEFVATISYTEWLWVQKNRPTFNPGMYGSRLERGQMAQLASYYMAVGRDAQRLSLDQQNYWNVRPDSVWAPAVEVDVGHPLRARHVIANGSDPKGQKYRIYAREFEHALVFMRPAVDWRPTVYGDDTAVEIPLPKPMRLLHRDGTLGSPVQSVKLRNVDAAIFLE